MKYLLSILFLAHSSMIGMQPEDAPHKKSFLKKISERLFKKTYQKRVFFAAVANGNAAEVERLLQLGIDPNTCENDGWLPLATAAYFGHVEVCQVLLNAHAKIDAANRKCSPALHLAADERRPEVCKLLIARGANVNAVHKDVTALLYAAQSGLPEICQLLVDAGADVNATNSVGFDALMKAMYTTQFGYDDDTTASTFQERLHNAELIFQILIKAGINVNVSVQIRRSSHYHYCCPLHYALNLNIASNLGSEILVHQLLSAGANIAQIDEKDLRRLFEENHKFLSNIVCAPNLQDIEACRKKISAVLLCFKQLDPRLPKDIQLLILSMIPDYDLGKILINRKLQGLPIANNLLHRAAITLYHSTFSFWRGMCDSLFNKLDAETINQMTSLLSTYGPQILETINSRLAQQKLLCNGINNF